jgi:hypothetical protein
MSDVPLASLSNSIIREGYKYEFPPSDTSIATLKDTDGGAVTDRVPNSNATEPSCFWATPPQQLKTIDLQHAVLPTVFERKTSFRDMYDPSRDCVPQYTKYVDNASRPFNSIVAPEKVEYVELLAIVALVEVLLGVAVAVIPRKYTWSTEYNLPEDGIATQDTSDGEVTFINTVNDELENRVMCRP